MSELVFVRKMATWIVVRLVLTFTLVTLFSVPGWPADNFLPDIPRDPVTYWETP